MLRFCTPSIQVSGIFSFSKVSPRLGLLPPADVFEHRRAHPRPPLGPEGPCGTLQRTPPEHKNFLAVNSTAVAPRGKATEHRGRRWLLFQWCPADEVRSTAVLHPKGRGRFRGAGIWGLYENSPFLRHPREQTQKRGRGGGKDDILSAWRILRFPK